MLVRQRGDTIIEVLFATTVFSLIAVGVLSIMNQGTAMAQRALEITLVREQIDAQADALRFLNHAYIADYGRNRSATEKWNAVVVSNEVTQAAAFGSIVNDSNRCVVPSSAFALNIDRLDSANPVVPVSANAGTYAQVRYDLPLPTSEGLWVQAVKASDHYDFHIRACWQSPGEVRPVTIGTIVRLYEPRP